MAAKSRSKGRLLGFALLGLCIAALLSVYAFFTPSGGREEAAVVSAQDQPRTASPSPSATDESVAPEKGAEEQVIPSVRGEAPGADPDPMLQDAELERLSGVFENSVYPSFRDDFQLDLDGRAALNAFVASMPKGLESEDLDRVSAMIEEKISGAEGEDVAFIITHLYRLEQEEARLMGEAEPVTTMAGQLEAQEQLSELRQQWFGPELSEKLFPGAEESQADGSSVEEPPETLSDEQAELAQIEGAWEQRYQRFLAERQYIDNAGLDQAEKDQQIDALLQQHFEPKEVEAAKAFDQMRQKEETDSP